MVPRWLWIVRLLNCFWLAPVRVSQGKVVRLGRLVFVSVSLAWASLVLMSGLMLAWSLIDTASSSCFGDVVNRTFRTFNVPVVVFTSLISVFTNAFCLVRLYSRDLVKIIGRNIELYEKTAGSGEAKIMNFSAGKKFFIIFVYLTPFAGVNIIIILCSEYSGGNNVLVQVLIASLGCLQTLPSTGMATVFFTLLDTAGETLSALRQRLLTLYSSRAPRPFLQPSESSKTTDTLTLHGLHALRMVHYEVVEFMEEVMEIFQLDILFFFMMSFCQNVMYNYSMVFNHKTMFRDRQTFYFVCTSIYMTVNLVAGLWMTCTGPTRIKNKQVELMNCIARLSTVFNLPVDLVHEIRIFQLQIRNHKASFEVFGMFELSYSLLFMMCASIVSYIVVLIQFADPVSGDLSVSTFRPENYTAASTG